MRTAEDAIHEARHFTLREFRSLDIDGLDPVVIDRLDDLRALHGAKIYPSKHPRGAIRRDGSESSRHHESHAHALDVFPEGNVLRAAFAAFAVGFRGVGLYLDTKRIPKQQPGPMLHVDLRDELTWWVRLDGEYFYPERGGKDHEALEQFVMAYSEEV